MALADSPKPQETPPDLTLARIAQRLTAIEAHAAGTHREAQMLLAGQVTTIVAIGAIGGMIWALARSVVPK